jgi:adenylate kinase
LSVQVAAAWSAARRADDDTQARKRLCSVRLAHNAAFRLALVSRPIQNGGEVNGSVASGKYSVTLLIGAPGAGKGTQAENVRKALGIPHVATGDLLREHRRHGTALGKTARAFMDRGELVPDDLVVQMVLDRLELPDAANGVLLDGFPRTMVQAESLDRELADRHGGVEVALFLNVPEQVLVRRLSGRRVCESCHGTFHIDLHPDVAAGRCPKCGRHLVHRRDDHPAAVAQRIAIFLKQTTAVLKHYQAQGIVHEVKGDQPVERIWADLWKILEPRGVAVPTAPATPSVARRSRTAASRPPVHRASADVPPHAAG